MSTTTTSSELPIRESLFGRLYNGRTNYEFVRNWKKWAMVSGSLILIGLIALATRGFNLGIDFKGGTVWEMNRGTLTTKSAAAAFNTIAKENPVVQLVGGDKIRVRGAKTDEADREKITKALAAKAGIKPSEVNVNFVGPSWGKDVSRKAIKALIIFFFVIAAYISIRFEWKMAIAALAAVVHDILITVGVYALTGFEVTPATVIAFLTILGFSLYDTIVVFDKVDENASSLGKTGKISYTDVVNLSMNQVLMRSLNTSFVAILPILSMLVLGVGVLGATAIRDFALALFIGLLIGAYSSIFVASPLLAFLKEREESWKNIRSKVGSRTFGGITPESAAISRANIGLDALADDAPTEFTFRPGTSVPRGRKLGKKR